MQIEIVAIYLSPGHDFKGHHGKPPGDHGIQMPGSVECVAGSGLVGDRYFDFKDDYKGQVTFFDEAVFLEAQDALQCHDRPPEVLRRNILTRGIDLNSLIGKTFRIGDTKFSGSQECAPCYWMNQSFAPGMEEFLKGRGGLRARIRSNGTLHAGPAELSIDD